MPCIEVKRGDRLHMLVWRSAYYDDQPWRVSRALNGIPVGFGQRCESWAQAMAIAWREAS